MVLSFQRNIYYIFPIQSIPQKFVDKNNLCSHIMVIYVYMHSCRSFELRILSDEYNFPWNLAIEMNPLPF